MSTLLRIKSFLYSSSSSSRRYVCTAHLLQKSCFLRSMSSDATAGNYTPPPDPIPNRPLRKSRNPHCPPKFPNSSSSTSLSYNNANNHHPPPPPRDETDTAFLERFKLGFVPKMDNNESGEGGGHTIPQSGIKPEDNSTTTTTTTVNADDIFNKMKETGLIPSAVAMLDGLCKDGLIQDAMKLFGLMREKGMIPEVVIYTAVVEGFCKAHKFDDAIRIFKKMQTNGVVPNAFTYGVFIRGLCNMKRFEDAYLFTIEMLEAGHSPNLATFTGLIDGYCKGGGGGGVEEAQKVINVMKQKGFFFEEKAVREFLDKKGPFSPLVLEAILGNNNKKSSSKRSLF